MPTEPPQTLPSHERTPPSSRRDGPTTRATTVRRATLAGTVAAAAAVLAAWWAYGSDHHFFDLRIYISAISWWADGNDLYDYAQADRVQGTLYFTYPPFAALLLSPLAVLDPEVTFGLFTAGSVVAVAVTTWWLVRPLAHAQGWPSWYAAGLVTPLVLLIEPSRETLALGQINMLLIVLILGDLLFAVPRGWRLAGVGVGLATALKLFPGIFICYLLVTRRWKAAITASAAAAGVTLLAAAIAPRASWQFWTDALWATERVGRLDYTGNQSLQGLLARLTVPADPPKPLWLLLAVAVAAYGLWQAARAARAGDEVSGIAVTGLSAALVSPITWPHHVYWFVPAVLVLGGVAAAAGPVRRRAVAGAVAVAVYAVAVFGVVSFVDYGAAAVPIRTMSDLLLRNAYVLASLALLAVLPAYSRRTTERSDLA